MVVELTVQDGALLLLIAVVVAILTRRFQLPYNVGLVAAGIGLAASPWAPNVELTKDLIFSILLPPLLFEAAFSIRWKPLRRDAPVIALLATVGVTLSAGITALGMQFVAGWQAAPAWVFGVLIAATDPVSVIATFREAQARGRLLLLLETESLFNDGTAAVGFAVAVAIAGGQHLNGIEIGLSMLTNIGGGILVGMVVGVGSLLLTGRTGDHLVEMTVTTIAAYGSFLIAERFHTSGVLATIAAGLVLGNVNGIGAFTERGREAVVEFWEFAAFITNSLVFLLIGMHAARQNFLAIWPAALLAIGLVILGRAFAIYPCCLVFEKSPLRVSAAYKLVLFWGGLRGALALALALGLPAGIPRRDEILTISFAVVAFSVFAQGLTIPPLLRRLGERVL